MAAMTRNRGNGAAKAEPKARVEQKEGDQKKRAIELAVSTIEKQFGKGSILTMTEDSINKDVRSFSSGAASIDLALGIGGYPRGRVVEIYGPESSGKTTLALHAVAEIQKTGGIAAFVDAEHALDIGYASRLDRNRLVARDVSTAIVPRPDRTPKPVRLTAHSEERSVRLSIAPASMRTPFQVSKG